jgi:hypothetical protein
MDIPRPMLIEIYSTTISLIAHNVKYAFAMGINDKYRLSLAAVAIDDVNLSKKIAFESGYNTKLYDCAIINNSKESIKSFINIGHYRPINVIVPLAIKYHNMDIIKSIIDDSHFITSNKAYKSAIKYKNIECLLISINSCGHPLPINICEKLYKTAIKHKSQDCLKILADAKLTVTDTVYRKLIKNGDLKNLKYLMNCEIDNISDESRPVIMNILLTDAFLHWPKNIEMIAYLSEKINFGKN